MVKLKFEVIVSVDEDVLKEAADMGEDYDLETALEQEFGWLEQSGIEVESIYSVEEEK